MQSLLAAEISALLPIILPVIAIAAALMFIGRRNVDKTAAQIANTPHTKIVQNEIRTASGATGEPPGVLYARL